MKKQVLLVTLSLIIAIIYSNTRADVTGWIYQLEVPQDIIKFEHKLMQGDCDLSIYECRFAYANIILIKKGLKPLYK
jgi:hypothetical protein